MTLTIHGIPAPRAIRPLWTACELGLTFEQVPTPYREGATRTPAFLALNPNGHIPVLIDARAGGEPIVVWESMACALYLARVYGRGDGGDPAPATPREEAEALRWSFWSVTELEKDALTLLAHGHAMPPAQRKADLAETARRRLKVPLTVLEAHLAARQAGGDAWLAAARFTIADLCVASVVSWVMSDRALMRAHPLVHGWASACLARPAYAAARALPG